MKSKFHTPHDVRLMNIGSAILLIFFVLFSLFQMGKWFSLRPVFNIHGITIIGDVKHQSVATVRLNIASQLNGNIFNVDLQKTRDIFENLPWVRRAEIHREFPNKLRVKIQEQYAAAIWGEEEQTKLVNKFGETFEVNLGELEQENLPILNGPVEQSTQVWKFYTELKPLFDAVNIPINYLELSNYGSWRLDLQNEAEIYFGIETNEKIISKTKVFLETVPLVLKRYERGFQDIEKVDLRHDGGYSLRLRGVTTQVKEEKL